MFRLKTYKFNLYISEKKNLFEYLVAFQCFQWAYYDDKFLCSPQDSQTLENQAFAITGARTENAIISLEYPLYQMDLPIIWCI
jgi:hypothetical protein